MGGILAIVIICQRTEAKSAVATVLVEEFSRYRETWLVFLKLQFHKTLLLTDQSMTLHEYIPTILSSSSPQSIIFVGVPMASSLPVSYVFQSLVVNHQECN